MHRLVIYICTKSKCTAKHAALKLRADAAETASYNGPALFDAIRALIAQKNLDSQVAVQESACMSGCPVGPRVDMLIGPRRIMYFQRKIPTGREELISWMCVPSVEDVIDQHLSEHSAWLGANVVRDSIL